MIVIGLPYSGNIAAAVVRARAGSLRKIELHALTIDMLQSLEFANAVEIVGCKNALDLVRPRNRIIFCNEGEKP